MSKKVFYSAFILVGIIFLVNINSYASSSATYFDGEAPKISNTDNIDILSNDVNIDTTASTIKNTLILKNTSNSKVTTKISFPLENNELSTSIHDLSINVNNLNITKYVTVESGNYGFTIEIPANESKKIIVDYKTDNDLQNAKVIKYSLDNLYGQNVKNLNVNININEKDIPLIKDIYPNIYTFNNNTINVNYYNFKVNNLTKDVIIEKETYKNLLYGQDTVLTNNDKVILKNIDDWIKNGIKIDYSKDLLETYAYQSSTKIKTINNDQIYSKFFTKEKLDDSIKVYYLSDSSINIMKYIISKQLVNDGKSEYLDFNDIYCGYNYSTNSNVKYNPLVENYMKNNYDKGKLSLYGKKICLSYKQTEDGKELYVTKNTSGSENMDLYKPELVKETESKILKTNFYSFGKGIQTGADMIFVGQGIDGTDIEATDAEKVDYVNMINADIFILVELYDGYFNNDATQMLAASSGNSYPKAVVGYYNEKYYDMAKLYLSKRNPLTEEEFNNVRYAYIQMYSTYQNYLNQVSEYYKESLKYINSNSDMASCEIPTFIHFLGFVSQENNKNVVEYFNEGYYNSDEIGLGTTNNVIETNQAKKLLEDNKNKNKTTKDEINSEIANIKITNDSEEFYKVAEPVNIDDFQGGNSWQNQLTNFFNKNKDIVVLSGIGIAIIICIIILIKKNKHNKKEKALNKNIK